MRWRPGTGYIYVDVDGTLLIWPTVPGGRKSTDEVPTVNEPLVKSLRTWRERTGGTIVIWTQGGIEHAQYARGLTGLAEAVCMPKPECIIDDAKPEKWARRTPVLSPAEFSAEVA